MPRGYYDIESILMEEERVPCRFLVPAPNVGSLDPAQGEWSVGRSHSADL
jgi:hypothetical protein